MISYSPLQVSTRSYLQALTSLGEFRDITDSLIVKNQQQYAHFLNPNTQIPFQELDKYIQLLQADQSYSHDYPFKVGSLMTVNRRTVLFNEQSQAITTDSLFRSFFVYFKLIMPAMKFDYFSDEKRVFFTIRPIEFSSVKTLNFHLSIIVSALYWSIYDILGGDVPNFKIELPLCLKCLKPVYDQLEKATINVNADDLPELRIQFPKGITFNSPRHFHTPYESQSRVDNQIDTLISYKKGIFSDWVCEMLQEPNRPMPTLTELAESLNLSIRTFERHLEKEGSGFRALCGAIKNKQAKKLLVEGFTVSEIANQLGFSSSRSFARSFKNYNQISPSQFQGKLVQ